MSSKPLMINYPENAQEKLFVWELPAKSHVDKTYGKLQFCAENFKIEFLH